MNNAPAPSVSRRLGALLGGLGLILVFITPFVWMVATSLKSNAEVFDGASGLAMLVPNAWRWQNYREIFTLIPFGRYLANSALTASASALLETGIAALAGFGLGILNWKGREHVRRLLFLSWLVPFSVVLIPRFFMMLRLPDILPCTDFWTAHRVVPAGGHGMAVGRLLGLDSFFTLVVPASVSITATFLLITAMERVPRQILDAAYLETGSHYRVFRDMVLPLVTPTLVTVAFIAFLSSWQSFTWPLLVTSTLSMQTATVGLKAFQTLHSTQWPLLMAGSVVLTLPSLGFLLLAQTFVIDRYQLSELTEHRI